MTADPKKNVQLDINAEFSTLHFRGNTVKVSADGREIFACSTNPVDRKRADNAAGEGPWFSVSRDFNRAVLHGVLIECSQNHHLTISVPTGATLKVCAC